MAKSRKYGRKMRSTRKKMRKSKRRGGKCGCSRGGKMNKKRGGDPAIDKAIHAWVSDPIFHQ